uniref:Uncharacterized protein n=1 Tax=Bionectria ochroleuca TaxID=29856 RepID=A0A8H7MZS7_BIOOC
MSSHPSNVAAGSYWRRNRLSVQSRRLLERIIPRSNATLYRRQAYLCTVGLWGLPREPRIKSISVTHTLQGSAVLSVYKLFKYSRYWTWETLPTLLYPFQP